MNTNYTAKWFALATQGEQELAFKSLWRLLQNQHVLPQKPIPETFRKDMVDTPDVLEDYTTMFKMGQALKTEQNFIAFWQRKYGTVEVSLELLQKELSARGISYTRKDFFVARALVISLI